eukprot:TRINITY_DN17974_c0_g1_i4.p1 TRINITY_DN17974_c0_g1~~TRINITY_DN17974_c0_g1_i4.p1  ORF type:complete len:761 (+),score=154.90 TRINITY_DN17974_c0_g1_i4:166-2283(+)
MVPSSLCQTSKWSSVAIGGGGYVTGLALHHTTKNVLYSRTDVGGAYRYDFSSASWTPITDNFSMKDPYYIESITVDESDLTGDTVYIAAGNSGKSINNDVYLSTNTGATWKPTGLANKVSFTGNDDIRWQGERLYVDPFDPKIMYYGSRDDGLWQGIAPSLRSASVSWKQVSGFPFGTANEGPQFIVCGETASLRNPPRRSHCATLFIGVAGKGVYRVAASNLASLTWSLETGSPARPARAALASDGTLYVTGRTGVGKRSAAGSWATLTPASGYEWCAITVDPNDPRTVIAGTMAKTFNNPYYMSTDAGVTWKQFHKSKGNSVTYNVPWWPTNVHLAAVATILYEPISGDTAFYSDWFGVYFGSALDTATHKWETHEEGHEELVCLALCAPPHVSLLSGHADCNAMVHPDVTQFPAKMVTDSSPIKIQNTMSFDYMSSNSLYMARTMTRTHEPLVAGDGGGLFSGDGGDTWTAFPTQKGFGGRIAVSATSRSIFWVPMGKTGYVSTNNGSSWTTSTGLSTTIMSATDIWLSKNPVTSDRKRADTYYVLDGISLKRSTNNGVSFSQIGALPSGSVTATTRTNVIANPLVADDVWVSIDGGGLYRWTAASGQLKKVPNVSLARLIAFGKYSKLVTPQTATLYVLGTVNSQNGVFYSNDLGASWVRMDDGTGVLWAKGGTMAADFWTWGKVYVGAQGRGVFVGQAKV